MTTRAYSACEGTYTSGEAHTFCILLLGVDSTPLRFKHWHMLDLPTYRCTPRKFGPVANSQGKCLQSTCEWFCRLCGRAALQCKIHSDPNTIDQCNSCEQHRPVIPWLHLDGRGHLLFHDLLILPWHRITGAKSSISQEISQFNMASET